MVYLKRKLDLFLEAWKQDRNRKPLIVKGPRQVGKTESIRKFGIENYENVIEINFVEEPKYKMMIADGYRTDDLIKNISRMDPSKHFVEGKTLLFFDELQELPEIATALKFFYQDGRYDVICSGSMLGIHYGRIESNSVGYKVDYEMHSLDFEEFLWGKGYLGPEVEEILGHMKSLVPFSQVELSVYGGLFLDYCILGGMPAVVREYIERGTFEDSLSMQRQLLLDYEEDVRKYAQGVDQGRIINIFRQIPLQLARDNKKFQISKVASGARFKDYRGCIEWMEDSGIIHVCRCMKYPELPLKGNFDEAKYKIYFADSGLLVAMLDEEAQDDLRANRNLGVYKGALYENVVGEALSKSGYGLYYYKKEDSTLEEDFFVRTAHDLIPVEVKSTNGRAKSLRTLIREEKYEDIHYGIKLTGANIGYSDHIYTFPYFCTFLLKRYLKERDMT